MGDKFVKELINLKRREVMKEQPEKQETELITKELRAIAKELHDLNANMRILIHYLKMMPVAVRMEEVTIDLAEGRL